MTKHSFQEISSYKSREGSVTHVSGTMCYPCCEPLIQKKAAFWLPSWQAVFCSYF